MFIQKLKCFIFGHQKYERVHQTFTPYSRRVICSRCGGDWAVNDDAQVTTNWNHEFAEWYRNRGHKIKPVKWDEK